jgi:hypothetical protein
MNPSKTQELDAIIRNLARIVGNLGHPIYNLGVSQKIDLIYRMSERLKFTQTCSSTTTSTTTGA